MSLHIFTEISRIDAMQKKIFNLHNLQNQKEKIKNRQKCTSNKYSYSFELLTREFIM